MENNFERFGIMIDCSRNAVMNVKSVKKWIDTISDLGYNTLMLYTEDTYKIENQPYFGYLRGAYTAAELKEIDSYASKKNVELIPCIQTLAHLNAIFQWGQYWDIRDCNDIMLAESEKTYALIEDMFTTLEKNFTSRTVNIGMDEAHMLGRGRYKDLHGNVDASQILLKHLNVVSDIAKKHGFKLIMWGDMFFRLMSGGNYYVDNITFSDNVKKLIPDNVDLVYWDYYSQDKQHYINQINAHQSVKENIWFAGGLWTWTGFAPHNGYSEIATKAALEACTEKKVKNVFLTMWGDNGGECSRFSLLPSLYYASEIAKGNNSVDDIKKGFKAKYGISFDDFELLDLKGTPNAVTDRIINTDKYMLYNDLFLGIFDKDIKAEDGKTFKECADKLRRLEDNKDYGFIFGNLASLCDVLSIKWDLGIRTRKAYRSGNKEEIKALFADYDALLKALEKFYRAFRNQWMTENKPNGFEVQDIRIGGLMQRVRNCKDRLEAFVNNEIAEIPELEEEILTSNANGVYSCYNDWGNTVSASVI